MFIKIAVLVARDVMVATGCLVRRKQVRQMEVEFPLVVILDAPQHFKVEQASNLVSYSKLIARSSLKQELRDTSMDRSPYPKSTAISRSFIS